MSKLKSLKYPVVGYLKPSVQKRSSRDNVGYIRKNMLFLYSRMISWVFSQDSKAYILLSKRFISIWDKNGSTFLVKYLKESYLVIQKYVSGSKVESTNDFPLGLVGGLPRIIPGPLRSKIRDGSPLVIRGVLTMFAVFRIIKCPGNLKLSTITDPFKGHSQVLPDYEVSQVLRSLFGDPKGFSILKEPKWLFLMSAGPNSSVSWKGLWLDIMAWSKSPLLPKLLQFIELVYGTQGRFYKTLLSELVTLSQYSVEQTLHLGRLSLKEEAAGKIRVFAITDLVTQSLFSPLNDFIFGLLKSLPTDGTFDQGKPLTRLLDLYSKGEFGSNRFWSYDLSAATDRLPLKFQERVLSLLFGNNDFGHLWGEIMSNRDWYLRQEDINLRYSVGQPMGALSSWAMLALSHHVIVQIAARRVMIKEFNHYALLGDDIVIANDAVAKSYHSLMTEILGVDINLSKSLISHTHFEYAKRLVSVDQELTPIGPKNLLIFLTSPNGIISVLRDAILKGLILSEQSVLNLLDTVPYYRTASMKLFTWCILGPFGLVPSEDGLSPKIRLNNSLTSVNVDMLISAIDDVIHEDNLRGWNRDVKSLNEVVRTWELLQKNPLIGSYNFTNSDLFFFLRESLLSQHSNLMENKPVRRFIFNGPLIHFGFYAKGWLQTVMEYITSKVQSVSVSVPSTDPFKDMSMSVPERSVNRSKVFFRRVYDNWVERRKVPRTYF